MALPSPHPRHYNYNFSAVTFTIDGVEIPFEAGTTGDIEYMPTPKTQTTFIKLAAERARRVGKTLLLDGNIVSYDVVVSNRKVKLLLTPESGLHVKLTVLGKTRSVTSTEHLRAEARRQWTVLGLTFKESTWNRSTLARARVNAPLILQTHEGDRVGYWRWTDAPASRKVLMLADPAEGWRVATNGEANSVLGWKYPETGVA